MKVNLINKAVYNMNTEGMTAIPANVFQTLVTAPEASESTSHLPVVRLFKTMSDLVMAAANEKDFHIPEQSTVYVNENGQIFVTTSDGEASEDSVAAYKETNTKKIK